MSDETWLVTGGCGFIGSALVARLLQKPGNKVRVVDNLSVGDRTAISGIGGFLERSLGDLSTHPTFRDRLELIVTDVRDRASAEVATRGCRRVVHLAANTGVQPSIADPFDDCETNVLGTLNYLNAARKAGAERFVLASSGATVGQTTPPIHENKVPRPVSPYGASKLAGEAYCSAYHGAYGLPTVALRFGNVYGVGSGHKNSVVAKFIRRALNGEPLEIYGDGTQTRDFVYIDDLLDAVFSAATVDGLTAEVFQVATSVETTVGRVAQVIVEALREHGYTGIEVVHASPLAGDVPRNFSDTSKAKRMLGWQAQVGLEQGIERTVKWFLGNA